jgi:hypothetical protein
MLHLVIPSFTQKNYIRREYDDDPVFAYNKNRFNIKHQYYNA